MIEAAGVTEEDLIEDFKRARRSGRKGWCWQLMPTFWSVPCLVSGCVPFWKRMRAQFSSWSPMSRSRKHGRIYPAYWPNELLTRQPS